MRRYIPNIVFNYLILNYTQFFYMTQKYWMGSADKDIICLTGKAYCVCLQETQMSFFIVSVDGTLWMVPWCGWYHPHVTG